MSKIFVNGKDVSYDIAKYEFKGTKCNISYKSNPAKIYPYSRSKVQIIEELWENEHANMCFSYLKQIVDGYGKEEDVADEEEAKTQLNADLNIDNVKGSNESNSASDKDESEKEKTSFLSYYYDEIQSQMRKAGYIDSVGADFLKGDFSNQCLTENSEVIIYPFNFNLSQRKAVEAALSNRISIIQGPPGTGKTQTILNILTNVVLRGETVAVVSGTNSATDNVFEKLEKESMDIIAAQLGNKDKKGLFFKNAKTLPDFSKWELEGEERESCKKAIYENSKRLSTMLANKNKVAELKLEIYNLNTESRHYRNNNEIDENLLGVASDIVIDSESAMEMMFLCENYDMGKYRGLFGFIKRKILELFGYIKESEKTARKLLKKIPRTDLIAAFNTLFYEYKETELVDERVSIEEDLSNWSFDEKLMEYSAVSARYFKDFLQKKYTDNSKTTNQSFSADNLRYWHTSEMFVEKYPVILSTTHSLMGCLSRGFLYDYVIIDEASQVDLMTGLLALLCAKNVVVVGDLVQLPHIMSRDAKKLEALFKEYNLEEAYDYSANSLLASMVKLCRGCPNTLLREHYRCHPRIIDFCNQKFYNGDLIILSEVDNENPISLHVMPEGNHARSRRTEDGKRKKITSKVQLGAIQEIIRDNHFDLEKDSIGFITPYSGQKELLLEYFGEYGPNIQAGTVHTFQGRENDIIILSTVSNEATIFSDNAKLLNVAVSRAVRQIFVLVNKGYLKQENTNIGELIKYIEYNNMSITKSEVYSVFYYLYGYYAKEKKKLLKKYKKQLGIAYRNEQQYPSEMLLYTVIIDVLEEEELSSLDVLVHYPLVQLVENKNELSEEELRYVDCEKSHVDFLILNKITRLPKLVIEVDGVRYHQPGTHQAKLDELKDSILKKAKLNLLRLPTDGHSEKAKIVKALQHK